MLLWPHHHINDFPSVVNRIHLLLSLFMRILIFFLLNSGMWIWWNCKCWHPNMIFYCLKFHCCMLLCKFINCFVLEICSFAFLRWWLILPSVVKSSISIYLARCNSSVILPTNEWFRGMNISVIEACVDNNMK